MACHASYRCGLYEKGECELTNGSGFCQLKSRLDNMFDSALIPENRRAPKKLEGLIQVCGADRQIMDFLSSLQIDKFIEQDKGFYLWSETPGNGKTSTALNICIKYINDKVWSTQVGDCRVLFVNVPEYLDALKDSFNNTNELAEHIKENVISADLVVWDDLATRTASSYEADILLSNIDKRLFLGKKNIFTTNVPPECLYQYMGQRLASRVVGNSYSVHFTGQDMRGR